MNKNTASTENSKDEAVKQMIIMRRAKDELSPYVSAIDMKSDSECMYLDTLIHWRDWKFNLRIECNRILRHLCDELIRLEPALVKGKVRPDTLKALIISLYASASKIPSPIRMQIKNHAGLFKNERLRKRAVSAKIMSGPEKLIRRKGVIESPY